MGRLEKFLTKVLSGRSDNNISFKDLCGLLRHFGFEERKKGSHHVFFKKDVIEILNIQSRNDKAKAYQVKQVRDIVIKYQLKVD